MNLTPHTPEAVKPTLDWKAAGDEPATQDGFDWNAFDEAITTGHGATAWERATAHRDEVGA
ncbi:MAG: hypothetical protein HC933_03990 [Pleurocapsa sp. SU_196_0]|nr:hypothetical protein [Pleurocapsa sp. SU_196_0]